MAIQDNIDNNLDRDFENHNLLPQKLDLEDIDGAIYDFISNLNLSVTDETNNTKKVPVVFLTQELWAERRMNWKNMRAEYGEEIVRPFIAMTRTGVKPGTSPLKRTIPVKKKFTFQKVPSFNGTMKGYDLWKIPQPTYVDLTYEVIFVTHYMQDVNKYYEKLIRDAFSDGQGYLYVNGYHIPAMIESTSESRQEDLASEKDYEITFSILIHGKLVDPTQFEKVKAVTRISIRINEKKN